MPSYNNTEKEPGSRPSRSMPRTAHVTSPAKLLAILVASVFSAELVVMIVLFLLREMLHPVTVVLVDAPLLVVILSPVLYFFLFKPLLALVEERKEAEKALSRERDKLRKYLEVAGVMVIVLNRRGQVELINRKGCEVLGYREDEIIGKDWFSEFIPERMKSEVKLVFTMLVSGSSEAAEAEGYYENPVVTRGGGERTVLWHNSVLKEDGRVIGILSSGEDITERKLTEKALKESEARYRLVHNTAFDGIIIANSQDRIIDCNDSAARIFGYARGEIIGMPVSTIVPEKYREAHRKGLKRFLETGESKVQGQIVEYEGVKKSGEIFPLELALNNFTLGGVVHFTAMIRDITERKKTERERELIQARLSQSQKMEAIGRFAGGIAHDFNNILTAIRGNAELAIEEMSKDDPLYPKVDGIVTSVMLASKLTRQLLLFSRGQPFELVPLDMNKVISDLLLMISRLIGEEITISTELAPDAWTIEADEGNVEQVIMNLAVNAKDAMPSGGKLMIKTENIVIDEKRAESIPGARPGETVRLTVADTGVGMSRELVSRIFEPFFTTKEAGKGTGFGLAVVYSIVKQHNGWISVESAPGKGTTFRIYFPVMSRRREAAARHKEERGAQGSGEKILLVEDDQKVRDFTRTALSGHGYKVSAASNAAEALELFEKEKEEIRMVLSDVVLSDQSGVSLAEQLLAKKPGLAVVLTSGYLEASQRPLLDGKGYSYLQKPYSMLTLLKTVSDSFART
ncbi:two-component system, cell cycle sensor histidine kinase and response regulator CckA [uncultured bacterium]|nr:two-component system, cell cycle sensor histidine kinase and response regulator CckA [uncultured bacterium]